MAEFDPKKHPRWPKGTPGIGGEFRPNGMPDDAAALAQSVFNLLDPKNPAHRTAVQRFQSRARRIRWSEVQNPIERTKYELRISLRGILKGGVPNTEPQREQFEGTRPYFAYGSNMSEAQMKERLAGAVPGGEATLPGHSLEFRGGVVNVEQRGGHEVPGALYHVTADQLAELDRREGVPRSYNRNKVTVNDSNGNPVDAYIYTMDPQQIEARGDYPPSPEYLNAVNQALAERGQSTEHVVRAYQESNIRGASPGAALRRNVRQMTTSDLERYGIGSRIEGANAAVERELAIRNAESVLASLSDKELVILESKVSNSPLAGPDSATLQAIRRQMIRRRIRDKYGNQPRKKLGVTANTTAPARVEAALRELAARHGIVRPQGADISPGEVLGAPSHRSVADRVDTSGLPPRTRRAVDEAIAAIDATHVWPSGTAEIAPQKKDMPSRRGVIFGAYNTQHDRLVLTPNADLSNRPRSVAIHELGHRMDEIMGQVSRSEQGREVLDAIRNSDAYRRTAGRSNTDYLRRPQEMFARAYMQWVAQKQGLQIIKSSDIRKAWQWKREDFAPIAAAMDQLFARRGLLKTVEDLSETQLRRIAEDPKDPRHEQAIMELKRRGKAAA